MSLLVLALVATAAGVLVAALAGSGRARRGPPPAPDGAAADLAFVHARGAEGLDRLLRRLFAELGWEVERGDRSDRAVDLVMVDPTPLRGGRAYVRGVRAGPGGAVDADDVRTALDVARAEGLGKVVLITTARFSAEAREAAREEPIELVDGEALVALVRRHLPQAWATREL